MPGTALAVADASPFVAPAASDQALASPTLTTILISPHAGGSAELAGLLRDALPTESVLTCGTTTDAIARAESARMFGRAAAIFLFDFRRMPVPEIAEQIRQVRKANTDAELVAVVDGRDPAVFAACLQVSQTPDKVTFLVVPFDQPNAVSAIRTVAERYRAVHSSNDALGHRDRAIGGLEVQVQELKARLDIAKHTARHDDLTGVLNRTGFVEELVARLTRNRRKQTVLMIDLDRFKAVNDTLGHDAGDELVRKICNAVSDILPAGGVLARLGGDEFGIVIEAPTDQAVHDLCGMVLRVCAQTRRVSGHEVQVSASIGVAEQEPNQSEIELLRRSDLALYAAKRDGRNRYRIFDAALDKATQHRLSMENGLERALSSAQFKMAYQPIVKAETGAILGFEALVRWNSPEHGQISPADFVPIAEETGLILDLGDWITRQAFKDCRKWGGLYVSVNVSARQFLRHNVAERILRYAAEANVSPNLIQVELTETAIIDDVERADHNLKILRAAGVRVALDDFGTGYSSLVYLNQFAIDCIKIDKSFVDNVTRDRQSAVIVASVSRLAASLGMSVVAEGVETEDQRKVLIAAGCGLLQGYHFGRPMAAEDVTLLLDG